MNGRLQTFLLVCGIAGLLLGTACRTFANQALLSINPANSSLRTSFKVTLGISSSTSIDTVPVSGFLLFDLNTNGTPVRLSNRHFDVHALRNMYFTNTVLFVSKLYTTINGIQVFDAVPGPLAPYFPLSNGTFTATNGLFLMRGTASYTGVAAGTYNLNSDTPQTFSNCSGTWQTGNGTNQAGMNFTFAFPQITMTNVLGVVKIDITGTGSLTASAPLNTPPPPAPAVACVQSSGQLVVGWPSSLWPTTAATNTPAGYWLYATDDLASPSGWIPEPTRSHDDGSVTYIILPMDAPRRFYRLEWR